MNKKQNELSRAFLEKLSHEMSSQRIEDYVLMKHLAEQYRKEQERQLELISSMERIKAGQREYDALCRLLHR